MYVLCMDVWMYGWMDVCMHGCMDVCTHGCMDAWMYCIVLSGMVLYVLYSCCNTIVVSIHTKSTWFLSYKYINNQFQRVSFYTLYT